MGDDGLKPLLVLGPSLGTGAVGLWAACAAHVADRFHVVAWDLPGHGASHDPAPRAFDMGDLAAAVLAIVDAVQTERGEPAGPFAYAGDSAGGAVGLQLLLDAPDRIRAAVLLCTSAAFGAMAGWDERARTVRTSGTAAVVELSARRWFGSGFLDHHAEQGASLLHALQSVDDEGYAQVCEALARFDVCDRLGEITAPVLAVAGSDDVATPPDHLEAIAHRVQHGRSVVLDGVGHLAPAEEPSVVAKLLAQHLGQAAAARPLVDDGPGPAADFDSDALLAAGMQVRRQVLGDAHVDRANAAVTDLTREFQELITRYAWGTIWTRPGLDRQSRSMITLTALIARGHHEELALHLRAARRNGLTDEEIREVLLQSAIYCGVPDANTAFRIAQQVLAEPPPELDEEHPS
ncbi:MAG: 4-carboxymuconolactone decarboxylase [Actinomycetota bacterium]|nr:4-carboxymuconolactone decarboxylase [Actinomycetota bacterium]